MIEDRVRMSAYMRAMRAAIKPGDTVVDIGCGTGILSLLAARCGPARVAVLALCFIRLIWTL